MIRMVTKHKSPVFQTDDARWAAVVARNAAADGVFYYAVKTTRVYCRPSCASRRARRENVFFYLSCNAAEHAGYRPCKRCRPDGPSIEDARVAAVEKACRLIERADTTPNLDRMAAAAGISRFHFHRVFKQLTGVTPKAYATAYRAGRVRAALAGGVAVTEAIYRAGFNSNGRFYANASAMLGMTPTRFRAGGVGERIRFGVGECSLGSILVAATERGICAISLGDDPDRLLRALQDNFPHAELVGGDAKFERWMAQVIGFVEAPQPTFDLQLDVRGTAFQQRVWQALCEIPPGSTVSYSDIAKRMGAPQAARAVARVCASNVIAVAIPCHRVVRRDGGLSGYRWGVERKQALLAKERK